MSRNIVAGELQQMLEQLQSLCQNAERVAGASGLVNPGHFRAIQTSVSLAAGELDQKGLLLRHVDSTPQVIDGPHRSKTTAGNPA